MENTEYLQIKQDLKNSVDVLLEGFFNIKNEISNFCKKKVDLSREFGIINLPSNGIYYKNKKKSLLIKHLTAVEEHILCDSFLMKSGKGIELILNELIIDEGIDIKNLLLCDFQAILIFLRANAYGDTIEIDSTCPHCGGQDKTSFKLSSLDFKKQKHEPDENGKHVIYLPELKMEFVVSPLTLAKEFEKLQNEDEDDYFFVKNDEGENTKIRKDKTLSLAYNIESINGIIDKKQIKNIIRKIPKKHVDYIIQFIESNKIGVDEQIKLNCSFCDKEFVQKIFIGYDFLTLPDSYKTNIYEETFLLTYYGKNITRSDAYKMPVFERRYWLNRISEEIKKQNEAEKSAMNKAKRGKGKF